MDKITHATIGPAYGRDYKSKKLAEADFFDGKDFMLFATQNGPTPRSVPCSIRDFAAGATVTVRYKRLTAVAVLTVPA